MENKFSYNIKKLRNNLKLTQKDFAEKIQVTAPTLNAYEKGTKKPTYDTLIKISKEFSISLDELCGLEIKNNLYKLENYADIFEILFCLFNSNELEVNYELIDKGGVSITIFDEELYQFIDEYQTMVFLINKGYISNKIFNEWFNTKMDKYYKIPISKLNSIYSIYYNNEENT